MCGKKLLDRKFFSKRYFILFLSCRKKILSVIALKFCTFSLLFLYFSSFSVVLHLNEIILNYFSDWRVNWFKWELYYSRQMCDSTWINIYVSGRQRIFKYPTLIFCVLCIFALLKRFSYINAENNYENQVPISLNIWLFLINKNFRHCFVNTSSFHL